MDDIHDLNKNTPAQTPAVTNSSEAEEAHHRVEHEANKAAERGIQRQKDEDQGEFSNVGPV